MGPQEGRPPGTNCAHKYPDLSSWLSDLPIELPTGQTQLKPRARGSQVQAGPRDQASGAKSRGRVARQTVGCDPYHAPGVSLLMRPWAIRNSVSVCSRLCSGFPGGSDGEESACSAGDPGSTPRSLGREDALEKETATQLQYSCQENPKDLQTEVEEVEKRVLPTDWLRGGLRHPSFCTGTVGISECLKRQYRGKGCNKAVLLENSFIGEVHPTDDSWNGKL